MAADVGLTREELADELVSLRQRVAELEEQAAERRRAEEALRESAERYRGLVDLAPDGIATIDTRGVVTSVNKAFTVLTGFSEGELVGKHLRELGTLRARDLPRYLRLFADLLRGRELGPVEFTYRRKDGEIRAGEAHVAPIRQDGKIVGLQAILRDIAERKLVEEALSESEEMFRQVAESIREVFFVRDLKKNQMIYVSPAYERIWAQPRESLYRDPLTFAEAIHPEDRKRVLEAIERPSQGEPYDDEYRIVRPDGELRWIRARSFPVEDEDGQAFRIVGLAEDITERVELDQRLRQASRLEAVGQLAAGVAHHFNNLMTVVNGYSEFVMNGLDPHDPMREDVKEIQRAGNEAARLTSQLLSFGRRQMLQMQVVSWNEVLEGMGGALESVVREDICLELKLASGLGKVKIDPGQMEQVLMGMVTNSCEAMPTGGVLVIETANAELDEAYAASHEGVEPGEYVMLAISDTGVGMTPEVQEHIFEPFFTTKGMALGTGLGLAAVYGMVKQIGGSIDVYSEPGQGTTFKIYLLRVDETQVRTEPERPRIKIPGGTETILVVEDNEGVRRLAVNLLARLGYKVLGAASGAEALGLVRGGDERIDLVLTDVVMPDMSGSELVGRLCKERPGLKAVYMSGYPDEVIMYHGVRVPESRLMQKPFHIQEVAERLREVLEEG